MFLKASTAVTVQLGPAVDSTDGVTPETALSPTVEVSKAGAAFVARNSATAIAHDQQGWYRVPLSTTDTATVGPLIVKFDESGTLPVWDTFDVLPANVYDSLVGGTDTLDVQVTGMGAGAITSAAIATGAIDADALAADAVDEIWAKTGTEITSVPGPTGTVLQMLSHVLYMLRNKRTQTASQEVIYQDDGSTVYATSSKSDDGTTFTSDEVTTA